MDLLLTIFFWLTQFGIAGLGVFVSLKPQPEERHRTLIIGFCVLALLALGANVVQQSRAKSQQFALEQKLGEIDKNTKRAPQRVTDKVRRVLDDIVHTHPNTRFSVGTTMNNVDAMRDARALYDELGNAGWIRGTIFTGVIGGEAPQDIIVEYYDDASTN